MRPAHPLLDAAVLAAIEHAASEHRGRRWAVLGFSDLNDRASHPCGILHGTPFSVFAKLGAAGARDELGAGARAQFAAELGAGARDQFAAELGAGARDQFAAELAGLRLLSRAAWVPVPVPVAGGLAELGSGVLLLYEALTERPPQARGRRDWRSIGQVLATLHQAGHARFGLDGPRGFFGPLPQDNRPVPANRWADFYRDRRLLPRLRAAVDSGHLPPDLAAGIDRVAARLPDLAGPEPRPSLLHGDAQQHNFVSTPSGTVVIDAAPYYGHPEADLALVDYFDPVPDELFAAYRDIAPIDPGFAGRWELWRLAAYLAVVAVDGHGPFGRRYFGRLADAIRLYR
jgi:fructosamine-3-kinase